MKESTKLESLEQHLSFNLSELTGDWLYKNSGYEHIICQILEMEVSKSRYWDAIWHEHFIEFKKGRSIWLDLVRYSEILLGTNDQSREPTICLFFIPTKQLNIQFSSFDRIEEIICVETDALIRFLGLSKSQAEALVEINGAVPRSLNAQASVTVNDVRKINTFLVR